MRFRSPADTEMSALGEKKISDNDLTLDMTNYWLKIPIPREGLGVIRGQRYDILAVN